jgi:hypothetical protein
VNENVTILFVFIAFTVLVIQINNIIRMALSRRYLHRERIATLERGMPIPEDLLKDESPATPKSGPRSTAVPGVVWTGVGLGVLISTNVVDVSDMGGEFRGLVTFLQIWAWPALMVGLGLLGHAILTRKPRDTGLAG